MEGIMNSFKQLSQQQGMTSAVKVEALYYKNNTFLWALKQTSLARPWLAALTATTRALFYLKGIKWDIKN